MAGKTEWFSNLKLQLLTKAYFQKTLKVGIG